MYNSFARLKKIYILGEVVSIFFHRQEYYTIKLTFVNDSVKLLLFGFIYSLKQKILK